MFGLLGGERTRKRQKNASASYWQTPAVQLGRREWRERGRERGSEIEPIVFLSSFCSSFFCHDFFALPTSFSFSSQPAHSRRQPNRPTPVRFVASAIHYPRARGVALRCVASRRVLLCVAQRRAEPFSLLTRNCCADGLYFSTYIGKTDTTTDRCRCRCRCRHSNTHDQRASAAACERAGGTAVGCARCSLA